MTSVVYVAITYVDLFLLPYMLYWLFCANYLLQWRLLNDVTVVVIRYER